jgi:1-deoxy-D-xylulose-5-phosphate reductoisomerase
MIRLAVLGSTGSIGRSALEVVDRHPDRFRVVALAAHSSAALLAEQVERFSPEVAVLVDGDALSSMGADLPRSRWRSGMEALVDIASHPDVDVVVNALVGSAGLEPTLRALEAGKRLALANKESLVAGGPLVMEAARRGGAELIPIDSEHSAILQCMAGYESDEVAGITLTASGGPFRGWSRESLGGVGPQDALQHPTWSMGAKISIDSATLANKALEVIEAHFLYGYGYDRIGAVIHPQSIVHSFVEFKDGSVLAQMGDPTMELPILYAMSHPERVEDGALRTFDPVRWSSLTFEAIDHDTFRMFGLGVRAGREGGSAPAVFNAANEVVVQAFLEERLGFLEMPDVVEATLHRLGKGNFSSVEEVLDWDRRARVTAWDEVERRTASQSRGI